MKKSGDLDNDTDGESNSFDEEGAEGYHDVDLDNREFNQVHKSVTDLTSDDIWGLEFDYDFVACEFYRTYSRRYDFAMRKDVIYCDLKENITMH